MSGHVVEVSDQTDCCSHYAWWLQGGAQLSGRRPFAPHGTASVFAPDRTVQVKHVKLSVHVNPYRQILAGTCETRVGAIFHGVRSLFFAAREMTIDKVFDEGGNLEYELVDDGLIVRLAEDLPVDRFTPISIMYHLENPRAGIYFISERTEPSPRRTQVWTQGQANDSQNWFPVCGADHPNQKMTSEMIVTVPRGFLPISNGILCYGEVHEPSDVIRHARTHGATTEEMQTFRWYQRQPHSGYLITLAVGEFAMLEERYDDVPVNLWCEERLLDRARPYFAGTAEFVQLFSELYGYKYAWLEYGQIIASDFVYGGMENTSKTTMTERILADARAFEEHRRIMDRLNAHELGHHWWGNLVTCKDWSHAWLNEGGASHCEVEMMDRRYGRNERDYWLYRQSQIYFGEDKVYRRPLVCNVYDHPSDLFDRHLYQKGSHILNMVRYLLGDAAYYKAVNRFFTKHAFQLVDTYDFINAIEEATGRNLRQFFDQWVLVGAGYPEYKVSYSWDESGSIANVKVTQTQTLENETPLFSMPIVLSFHFPDGTEREISVQVGEKEQSFHIPLDQKPDMFRFDKENWVLKSVQLDVPRAMLLRQLASDPNVTGRIIAAKALTKLGGLDVVAALANAVRNPDFWGVSFEAAECLGIMGGPAARDALLGLLSVENPLVRRGVVAALGHFKDECVAEALIGVLSHSAEESYFVLAEAALALGKTRSKRAFAALKEALEIPSWNEVVRVGALRGLAELGDKRGINLAYQQAAAGMPDLSRPAAIVTLGKLAARSRKGLDLLHELAASGQYDHFLLAMAIAEALGSTRKPASIPELQHLMVRASDSRVKMAARHSIADIEAECTGGAQVDGLKAQLETLTEAVAELRDRLAGSEAQSTQSAA